MRFEFEYRDEQGAWQTLGIAEGSGEAAVVDAFNDLTDGQDMAVGRYRARPEDDAAARWAVFNLNIEGEIRFIER